LTLDEQQYVCLGRRFSKHKITRYAKNLGGPWPPKPPGWLRLCTGSLFSQNLSKIGWRRSLA